MFPYVPIFLIKKLSFHHTIRYKLHFLKFVDFLKFVVLKINKYFSLFTDLFSYFFAFLPLSIMLTLSFPAPTIDVPLSAAVKIITSVSLASGTVSSAITTVKCMNFSPGFIWTSPEIGSFANTKSSPGVASPDDEMLLRGSG